MKNDIAKLERKLRRTGNDTQARIDILCEMAEALGTEDPDRSLALCTEAYELAAAQKLHALQGKGLGIAAKLLYSWEEYEPSLNKGLEAIEFFRITGDRLSEAELHIVTGSAFLAIQASERARDSFQQSLDLLSSAEASLRADAYAGLSESLAALGLHDEALAQAQQAFALQGVIGNDWRALAIQMQIAILQQHLGNTNEALEELRAVQKQQASRNDLDGEAATARKIGDILLAEGETDKARSCYRRARSLSRKLSDPHGELAASIGTARSMLQDRSAREAVAELEKSIAMAEKYDARSEAYEITLLLADGNRQMKRHSHATQYYEEALRAAEAAYESKVAEQMERAAILHRVERAEQERLIQIARDENRALLVQQNSDELASLALRMIQRTELLDTFKELLQRFERPSRGSQKNLVEKTRAELEEVAVGEEEWETFERQLNESQHHFLRELTDNFPSLTRMEKRICALLRISLSSRDIAEMHSVTVRDIETHRYNIRKKLAIPTKTNLTSFLTDFGLRNGDVEAMQDDQSLTAKLSARYPELTPAEIKICSMLATDMTTKEIAEVLNLSARTVERHRYNIRKKLGSENVGTDLKKFLATL